MGIKIIMKGNRNEKILIFTDSFLPGFKGGGPITSISNLVSLLNENFNILICTRDRDFGDVKPYTDIEKDKITKYAEYNIIYLSSIDNSSISKVIKNFNPDLLYLNSFFSSITQTVMFVNKIYFNKKLIVAPRGELQENALNIKKMKKSTYIFIYKLLGLYKKIYFHSTDIIETKCIQNIFNIDNITQLQNAVKISKFEPLAKKENNLKIIFVSRISKKKNLHYALNLFKDFKYNIVFDIYGPKEDADYWDECQHIVDTLPENISVSYKGSLAQNKIVEKMREYHAFLFPTLSENFGHVIVEAMQAGLVPLISDQTPWLNLDNINAGWDIPLNKDRLYIEALEELYTMNNKSYTKKSLDVMRYIHKELDIDKLKRDYKNFFNQTIGDR